MCVEYKKPLNSKDDYYNYFADVDNKIEYTLCDHMLTYEETVQHSKNVALLSLYLAQDLLFIDIDKKLYLSILENAALSHDTGKFIKLHDSVTELLYSKYKTNISLEKFKNFESLHTICATSIEGKKAILQDYCKWLILFKISDYFYTKRVPVISFDLDTIDLLNKLQYIPFYTSLLHMDNLADTPNIYKRLELRHKLLPEITSEYIPIFELTCIIVMLADALDSSTVDNKKRKKAINIMNIDYNACHEKLCTFINNMPCMQDNSLIFKLRILNVLRNLTYEKYLEICSDACKYDTLRFPQYVITLKEDRPW